MNTVEVVGELMLGSAVVSVGLFILFYIFGSGVTFAPLFWGVFAIHAVVAGIRWINENQQT